MSNYSFKNVHFYVIHVTLLLTINLPQVNKLNMYSAGDRLQYFSRILDVQSRLTLF